LPDRIRNGSEQFPEFVLPLRILVRLGAYRVECAVFPGGKRLEDAAFYAFSDYGSFISAEYRFIPVAYDRFEKGRFTADA
jgi:hypothetical protein